MPCLRTSAERLRAGSIPMLVIFDCDGVLVDSEPIANRILAELLSEAGLPTSTEDSMRLYKGRTQSACVELASARLGRPLPADLFARFDDRFYAACRGELRAIPGIEDSLRALARSGIAICVASSGSREKMAITLGMTGLIEHFEGRIFSATEVARSKPFPDVFLHAARAMGVPAAACCVVEDSALGVEAGLAAGMRVLGFAGGGDSAILSRAGAHVFHEMEALPGLVTECFGTRP